MKRIEQFQDMIARLYPELSKRDENAPVSKTLSRTITFQVTDECNLCCFQSGTKILMSDYTYKNIEDIKIGDYVMGFNEKSIPNKQRNLSPTKVTHLFKRHDNIVKLTDANENVVYTTAEHPFLDGRGNWKRVEDLSNKNKLSKFIGYNQNNILNIDTMDMNYIIGYVISAWLGDGHIAKFKHGKYIETSKATQSRLAQKDMEIIYRMSDYLQKLGIDYSLNKFKISKKHNIVNDAIFLNDESSAKLRALIFDNFNANNSVEYLCGFLAGIYDTEGNIDGKANYIRIFNTNTEIMKQCEFALKTLGFDYTYDNDRESINYILKTLRLYNPRNTNKILEFLLTVKPAVSRKGYETLHGKSCYKRVGIKSVEYTGIYDVVYNFETESHTYIANDFMVHNCTYCYQINKGKRRMNFETAKKLIDMLLSGDERLGGYVDVSTSPGLIIEFIGGEPFLCVDLIDQICDYFYSRAIELMHPWATMFCISICSNGVLYFDPKVQKFLNKWRNNLSFSITIDGNKSLHDSCRVFADGSGSYDLAVSGAQDWIKRGYYMGSKITIAPENLPYLYDAITHMVELGYDEINANVVYEKGWEIKHAQQFYKQLIRIADYWLDNDLVETHYLALFEEGFFKPKKEGDDANWCGGTGAMLAIDPDGYLYPCLRYMESSLGTQRKPLRIGHVDEGIGQTKCTHDCIECLNAITRRTQSTDECYNCPIAEGCSWCSAYNYQENGTPDSRCTYICDMHKARSLANVYFWNTWYRKKGSDKRFEMHCPEEWALKIIDQEEYEKLKNLSYKKEI